MAGCSSCTPGVVAMFDRVWPVGAPGPRRAVWIGALYRSRASALRGVVARTTGRRPSPAIPPSPSATPIPWSTANLADATDEELFAKAGTLNKVAESAGVYKSQDGWFGILDDARTEAFEMLAAGVSPSFEVLFSNGDYTAHWVEHYDSRFTQGYAEYTEMVWAQGNVDQYQTTYYESSHSISNTSDTSETSTTSDPTTRTAEPASHYTPDKDTLEALEQAADDPDLPEEGEESDICSWCPKTDDFPRVASATEYGEYLMLQVLLMPSMMNAWRSYYS